MCYLFDWKDFFIHEMEEKYGLESESEIYLQFFTNVIKEHGDLLCKV